MITPNRTLTLSRDEMRALGYQLIDILTEHFETLSDKPVTHKSDRETMESLLREKLPENGLPPSQALDQLMEQVFSNIMHTDHPRFFAFVPSPSNFISVLADALTSCFNPFAGTWLEASGPAMIELVTIDWLRSACGLPKSAGGLFVSGGSMANMTALAVARQVKLGEHSPEAIVYCSDQTHSSVMRGLRVLGFQEGQIRILPSVVDFRLDPDVLIQAIKYDRDVGKRPFCVVANAGTTNSGAVDPLPKIVEIAKTNSMWLHVDGAYGASAVLTESGSLLLQGLGDVDSIAIDPHKWLFQPYEIGCVLVKEERWLMDTFHILPEYLADIDTREGEVNFCDRGIQLTRSFRALKLWLSLKIFGASSFRQAIEHGMHIAEFAEQLLKELPDWEVVTPAQLGILTFRFSPPGESFEKLNLINSQLVERMIADGFAMLSTTSLRGKTVLRMCTINPRTTKEDVQKTIHTLDQFARTIQKGR